MVNPIVVLTAAVLAALPGASNDNHELLRQLVAKSEAVAAGVVLENNGVSVTEFGVVSYSITFRVSEPLKGDIKTGKILVDVQRFEVQAKEDRLPGLKKDETYILFLRKNPFLAKPPPESPPVWTTSDYWFAVQPSSVRMADKVKALAAEKK